MIIIKNLLHYSELKTASVLLFLSAAFGLILIHDVPPMGGFDEAFHWRRTVELADGHFLAKRLGPNDYGDNIDSRALDAEEIFDTLIASQKPGDKSAIRRTVGDISVRPRSIRLSSFPSTGSFSPLAYMPSAVGVAVARAGGRGFIGQNWCGRVANLFFYLLLVGLSVWILPIGRFVALLVLLMPTPLHLASSFSADPVSNGLPVLLVACCLRLHFCREKDLALRVAVLILAALVGLLKLTCCIVSLAVLLVPSSHFQSRRASWFFRILVIGVSVLTALVWNHAYSFVPGIYWKAGADPDAALQVLGHHPIRVVNAILHQLIHRFWFFWQDAYSRFGGGPGPYHYTVPPLLSGCFGAAALAMAAIGGGAGTTSRPTASRMWPAFLLATLATDYMFILMLAFRIGYGPPAADYVQGLQGRYFTLPFILILLSVALVSPFRRLLPGGQAAIIGCSVIVNLLSIIEVVSHYRRLW